METARPRTVAVVFLVSYLFLWSTVADATACTDCKTMRCQINCGAFAGKRSDVSKREDLGEIRMNIKPSPNVPWSSNQRCTLDVWFGELPLEWQRQIILMFQLASRYVDEM